MMSGVPSTPSTPGPAERDARGARAGRSGSPSRWRSAPTASAPRAGWSAATMNSRPSPRSSGAAAARGERVGRWRRARSAADVRSRSKSRAREQRRCSSSGSRSRMASTSAVVGMAVEHSSRRCDERAGDVGEAQDALEAPAFEQPVAERAAEGVAGAEPVDDVDEVAAGPRRSRRAVLASTPFGPCLTIASSHAALEQGVGRAERLGLADRHLALLAIADRDGGVLERQRRPARSPPRDPPRTSAGSRGRAPCARRAPRASSAA